VEIARLFGNDMWRIIRRQRLEAELTANLEQQRALNKKLEEAQSHLLQSEKMASLGQLSAGVAHELNNPIGFVYSNMGTLEVYLNDIFSINSAYEALEQESGVNSKALAQVHQLKRTVDYDYIKQDIFQLMSQSKDGLSRMRKIVQDLKDFAHVGEEGWQWADLHKGLDSTLNIVWNELKYKCQIVKEYGTLPQVYCMASQINQVFMNLLVNAGQAIQNSGVITIRTGVEQDSVWIEIADTGKGMTPEQMKRIFEPFYTTKPVGEGTGLGLSLSYGIIQKHNGRIEVKSEIGRGTVMRIWLPEASVARASA
jgi:two-component system, NtrC family, sensor kinase